MWNKRNPFCCALPTGADGRRDSIVDRLHHHGADWNDTRFFSGKFDKIILEARAELDTATDLYREGGHHRAR